MRREECGNSELGHSAYCAESKVHYTIALPSVLTRVKQAIEILYSACYYEMCLLKTYSYVVILLQLSGPHLHSSKVKVWLRYQVRARKS
jgi:hypothetical protein